MDGQATSKGRTDIDYTVMVQWHILHACQGNNEKKPKKKKNNALYIILTPSWPDSSYF